MNLPYFTSRLFCFILLLACLPVSGQSVEKGYTHLIADELLEARKAFTSASKKKATAADGYLGLSIVAGHRGNPDEAERTFREFLLAEQDTERRNVYRDAFVDTRGELLTPEALQYLEEKGAADYGRLTVLRNWALANHYDMLGQFAKADNYYQQINFMPAFAVTGAFENISESGFTRDFGVLAGATPDSRFRNKNGVEVKWFPGKVLRKGTLNFGQHFITNNTVCYAQTFVTAPAEGEVDLRLGVSGSAKVWVNDELVFSEREERATNYDAYVFPARLLKGNNRILVQVGTTTGETPSFCLRLTDTAGKPIPALTYSNEYADYPKPSGWKMSRRDNPTETHLREWIAADKNPFLNYLALIQHLGVDDRRFEQRAVTLEALERFPDNVTFLESLSTTLAQLDDDIGSSEIDQYIRELDPTSLTAIRHNLTKAKEDEDWTAYEKHLAALEREVDNEKMMAEWRVQLHVGRQEMDKLIESVEWGFKKFPANADYATTQVAVLRQFHQMPDSAKAILTRFNDRYVNFQIMNELAEVYEEEGDTDALLALNDRKLQVVPLAPGFLRERVDIYEKRKEYDKADETLELLLEQGPYVSSYFKQRGDLAAKYGDKKVAAGHYRSAIALNPYDYDSRSALRDLEEGGGTAFAVFPEKDYYQLAAEASGQEAHPNDHSYIVSYDVQQIVHEGGASETRTALLIKVFNSNGVDRWKEYTIPIGNGANGFAEKVEVIDPDGSRHEASRNGADVVFDGLKPGGCILLVFRTQNRAYGRLSGKFWGEHFLSSAYPTDYLTYDLLVPKGMQFDYKVTGLEDVDAEPKRSTLDGRDRYTWSATKHPGETPEASSPSWDDLVANVRVTNVEDWAFIANWYAELTRAKVRPDDYVRQVTEELFADAEGLTRRQEVERIYDYITGNIRYVSVPFLQSNFVPQRASKTLTTSQGDCKDVSSLFVAMCQLRGIPANLVLVSTRDRAMSPLEMPTIAFNHCIGRVELDGEPYYVELTDETLPFGTGDWSVNGAFALTIPNEGETFNGEVGPINPPSRKRNEFRRNGKISFEGKDLIYELKSTFVNNAASGVRSDYLYKSAEEQKRIFQESINGLYPRTTVESVSFGPELEGRSPAVNMDFRIRASEPGQEIAGMAIYDIEMFDRFGTMDYLATDSRQFPLDLWQTFYGERYRQELTVSAPEGKKLVEKPEDVTISTEHFDYALRFAQEGDQLTINRSFDLKQDLVAPADYPAFREAFQRVIDADKIALAFR